MNVSMSDDWDDGQKQLYVRVYRFMVQNQNAIRSQAAPLMKHEQWDTLCHNAAYAAAEFLRNEDLTIIDTDDGAVVASTPEGLNS